MEPKPGDKLGPYEILAPIGKGGMGEVWKARDPRLNRDVAIKVSAQQFTDRFEREARAIAALNHPNVCTLYHIGPDYLVMELIEGPTLADRIKEGPIPLDEALTIARQIADALEAAHEKGIVHRDLKPGNVKSRPDGSVKVLDFGLAKASGAETTVTHDSPTLIQSPTQFGVILGTAAYMAPEQARGKTVDKRADIWAFGVVLYEMLTGKRLFEGEDLTETLASVMKSEPDLTPVPRKVRRLLAKCLEKDPKKRLRDIGDAWELLEQAEQAPRSRSRFGWPVAAACVFVAFAGWALGYYLRPKTATNAALIRYQIPRPESTAPGISEFAISPDGRHLVYATAGPDGVRRLWLHNMDSFDTRPLMGSETEGVLLPIWSPDSRYVAFSAGGKLRKIDITVPADQTSAQTICDAAGTPAGGSWSLDGTIIFAVANFESPPSAVIKRVAATGGSPTTVVVGRKGELLVLPAFLPDARHFLYLRLDVVSGRTGAVLGFIDTKPEQQAHKPILDTPSAAVYVPDGDSSGQVLFLREATLFAQRFDLRSLSLTGEPVHIAESVSRIGLWGAFSASENGVLIYVGGQQETMLTWFNRHGDVMGTEQARGFTPALSPDGTRVAYAYGAQSSLWLLDRSRSNRRPLTHTSYAFSPVWSPDGKKVAFAVAPEDAGAGLYVKNVDDERDPELLLKGTGQPTDWSADGRYLIYTVTDPGKKSDIRALPLNGGQPIPIVRNEFNEQGGVLSPDSHWIAYVSDESGRKEVYVRPFRPVAAGESATGFPVSNDGAWQVRWRRDGKELFYQTADGKMMSIEIASGPEFRARVPKLLFQVQPLAAPSFYGVSKDGSQFLVEPQGKAARTPFNVVLNWTALLKK
jgi:eukaryotic-like serine/threonine-protein kinase